MADEMKSETFNMLWETIPQERKDIINKRINTVMLDMVKNGKIIFDKPYDWSMNFPFDREEPRQYIYLKGVFGLVKGFDENKKEADALINRFQYIEISDEVDNYLDRRDEIKDSEGDLFKLMDDGQGNIIKEIRDDSDNEGKPYIETILDGAEVLQKEMHKIIDDIRKTERGSKIPYTDLQSTFYLMKIGELQNQIKKLQNQIKNQK